VSPSSSSFSLAFGSYNPSARKTTLYLMSTVVDGTEYIKIGVSSDPMRRRSEVQRGRVSMPPTWDGEPVVLIAICSGATYDDESYLHEQHSFSHVAGEWFYGSEKLVQTCLSYGSKWERYELVKVDMA
jgi:hypothetical protein